jgi:hypothetical protein
MFVSDEINWSLFDFIIMGLLILSFCFGMNRVLISTKKTKYRILLIGVILIVVVIIWAELSVGLFRTPFAGF